MKLNAYALVNLATGAECIAWAESPEYALKTVDSSEVERGKYTLLAGEWSVFHDSKYNEKAIASIASRKN